MYPFILKISYKSGIFISKKYTEENAKKANRFGEIICSLVENPEELYRIVEEESDGIEWD